MAFLVSPSLSSPWLLGLCISGDTSTHSAHCHIQLLYAAPSLWNEYQTLHIMYHSSHTSLSYSDESWNSISISSSLDGSSTTFFLPHLPCFFVELFTTFSAACLAARWSFISSYFSFFLASDVFITSQNFWLETHWGNPDPSIFLLTFGTSKILAILSSLHSIGSLNKFKLFVTYLDEHWFIHEHYQSLTRCQTLYCYVFIITCWRYCFQNRCQRSWCCTSCWKNWCCTRCWRSWGQLIN